MMTPAIALEESNMWDVCHSLVRDGVGAASGAPQFAEPDVQQPWIMSDTSDL